MGQILSCECLQQSLNAAASKLNNQLQIVSEYEKLHKESKFKRKAYLGLTTQDLYMKLAEDKSFISWRVPVSEANSWTSVLQSEEFGELSLIDNVATVRAVGTHGLVIIDFSNKSVFEVVAEDAEVRDNWVLLLNKLLQDWIVNPMNKPKTSGLSAKGTSDKAAYFAMREQQMEERKKIADEKRAKYTAGGMKYTAIAMMNRES